MKQSNRPHPHRGDIYLVEFDPSRGAEIKKTRPALVVQNDVGNQKSPITIVAAITSRSRSHLRSIEVRIPAGEANLDHDSVVVMNQVRSIDHQRLLRKLGHVSPQTMKQVDQAIAVSFGLVEA